jgi:hypothetical protein
MLSYHYYSLEAIWTNIFGQITTTNANSRGGGNVHADSSYSFLRGVTKIDKNRLSYPRVQGYRLKI